jgi:hypothetical protein
MLATQTYGRINTDLFIGNKSLQSFNFYGRIFYFVSINIFAFPIENFDNILENLTTKKQIGNQ